MSDVGDKRSPTICLNMIDKNEAHIVRELLDAVSDHISSWVIVDTGSDDGTQDVIRTHMEELGIPGELHERPWRNFGFNRTEALKLAQGHADYIWVMDADDVVVGTPDFSELSADVYAMRVRDAAMYWRRQLFRDGVNWYYKCVLHEYAACDDPVTEERLEGDYHIHSRRLGGRNLDPRKYERDCEVLLAEVEQNPDDGRSIFYLAQSYEHAGHLDKAMDYYTRRATLAGWEEETFMALYRLAGAMEAADKPWQDVQDAYWKAFESRPTRAEPLQRIASGLRRQERYQLGYLFARRAAEIPFPSADVLWVEEDIYTWRALDEQAVCASRVGKHIETVDACRRLLALAELPDEERPRIAGNRDVSAPLVWNEVATYPSERIARMPARLSGEVTVSLVCDSDRAGTEVTLNSFLRCCLDADTIGRILALDTGLSTDDRAALTDSYGFLEFIDAAAPDDRGRNLRQLRDSVDTRYWLHLGQGWRFFAPELLLTRLCGVLEAEPSVVQAGVNFEDSTKLINACAPEGMVRRAPGAGRYVMTADVAGGPAMFDMHRLRTAMGIGTDSGAVDDAGYASLDEVLCVVSI